MDEYEEELKEFLTRKEPWEGYKYRPLYMQKLLKRTLGERYLEELEEEGDEEEVFKKFLRIGLRGPGSTKSRVEAYLKRVYEEAKREGRI